MTTLVRWTPFREFDLMERRMCRVLEDVGIGPIAMPAADVYETPEAFVVELEVPGFDEPQLGLEVTDHMLTITGDATAEKEETGQAVHPPRAARTRVRTTVPAARGCRRGEDRGDVR